MDIGRAHGVDFDVFLILGREERFVDVGSCSTRKFERRIKFRRLVTNLNEKNVILGATFLKSLLPPPPLLL